MRAILRRLHSPDVDDLSIFVPRNRNCFSLLIQVMVGPSDSDGEESFNIEVCTPMWLEDKLNKDDIVMGLGLMIVKKYDFTKIEERIRTHLLGCIGDTWDEVASKVAKIGRWEFDDYREK